MGPFEKQVEQNFAKITEQESPSCPACNGPGMYMGTLGSLDHFRCQNCGMDFSRPADDHNESLREANAAANHALKQTNYTPSTPDHERLHRELTRRGFVRVRMEPAYIYRNEDGLELAVGGLKTPEHSVTANRSRYSISATLNRRGLVQDRGDASGTNASRVIDRVLAFVDDNLPLVMGESRATPFNESKDSTGKELKVGDTVVYSGTFLRNIGMYAGDMTQDAGSVTDVKPLSGDRSLVTVDFDIAGEMKVLSVNLTRKDRVQYEPR